MNLARKLIRLCEFAEKGRNRIFLKEKDNFFVVDTTLADYERNDFILNTINDLVEGGNWNQLNVVPADNMYITEYRTPNGKLKEFKSNMKKYADVFQFTNEADAREFFELISVDVEETEEEEQKPDIEVENAEAPESVDMDAVGDNVEF